eukprot:RCo010082
MMHLCGVRALGGLATVPSLLPALLFLLLDCCVNAKAVLNISKPSLSRVANASNAFNLSNAFNSSRSFSASNATNASGPARALAPRSPVAAKNRSAMRFANIAPFNPWKYRWYPLANRSYDNESLPAPVLPPDHQLYARLPHEPGLRTLVRWLETMHCYDELNRTTPSCRRMEEEEDSRPLCLRPEHLRLPDKWVSFEEFQKAEPMYPFPYPVPMQTK